MEIDGLWDKLEEGRLIGLTIGSDEGEKFLRWKKSSLYADFEESAHMQRLLLEWLLQLLYQSHNWNNEI